MLEDEQAQRASRLSYAPVGTCIYCRSRVYDPKQPHRLLGDEHIIPEGLDGRELLPNASCMSCEGKTSAFEGNCLRRLFGPIRLHFSLPSKRLKDRPTTLPMIVKYHGDETEHLVPVPVADHPGVLVMPSLDIPLILGGSVDAVGWRRLSGRELDFAHVFDRKLEAIRERLNCRAVYTTNDMRWGAFERLLAKIGHSYAVAQFGLDAFHPFLADALFDNKNPLKMFVGSGDSSRTGTANSGRHHLSLEVRKRGRHELIVVNIGFFRADGFQQTHSVVAGRFFSAAS